MQPILPRLIRQGNAPGYLGMCREMFDEQVRPYLTEIPIGHRGGVAYDRHDLDAFATYLKNNTGRPPRKRPPWEQQPLPALQIETRARSRKKKTIHAEPIKTQTTKAMSRVEQMIGLCLQVARDGSFANNGSSSAPMAPTRKPRP